MEPQQDLAIILRSVAFEDRHRIVTALTENHGQVSAMARNAVQSRRFGGCLEPFVASLWQYVAKEGSDLWSLREAGVKRSYEGLRKDFQKLSLAAVFNEMMLRVAPHNQPCRELFLLHTNALAILEEDASNDPNHFLPLLNAYLGRLLQWSGNQPQLSHCMSCQTPARALARDSSVTCVIADAGWICADCRMTQTKHLSGRDQSDYTFRQAQIRVTPNAIEDFDMGLSLPIRQVLSSAQASSREHRDLFHFLESLFVYHLPGFDKQPLKSLRFLDLQSSLQLQAASRP